MRKPDFNNVLKVLARQVPDRPTLFEFFMNPAIYQQVAPEIIVNDQDKFSGLKQMIVAFERLGYDYVTLYGSDFRFQKAEHAHKASTSLNEGYVITDRKTFNAYQWPDPQAFDYSRLELLKQYLPDGMKFIVYGPGGVLENVIELVGFDNLCLMLYDDPELVEDIFTAVGERLVAYYKICAPYESVGALISNDDWGFNTQTMLSPKMMRQYVFPWHKQIVEAIHSAHKPAILHSCGKFTEIIGDIIYDMKYDARHSYEDNIMPVEEAYERWGKEIAILGGIDLNFLCTSKPEAIKERCYKLLEKSSLKGGYALGSGNSIPYYVPAENYFAMIECI